ncbi:MAG: hypothetical protein ACI8W8_001751 [Rhodothermales bacterium]
MNPGIIWVHNDRNNAPRLYALNQQGKTVGTYVLDAFGPDGTMAGDWEDMARVPKSDGTFDLYIGDIGNNAMATKEHEILVVSEPKVDAAESAEILGLPFKRIRFRYPDGYACNSECLMVNPLSKEIVIISKSQNR